MKLKYKGDTSLFLLCNSVLYEINRIPFLMFSNIYLNSNRLIKLSFMTFSVTQVALLYHQKYSHSYNCD